MGFAKEFKKNIDEHKKIIDKIIKEEPYLRDIAIDEIIIRIEDFLYSNVVGNFYENLTPKNMEECAISNKELEKFKKYFDGLFTFSLSNDNDFENKPINADMYYNFENQIKEIFPKFDKLLDYIKKILMFDQCEEIINKFKKDFHKKSNKISVKTSIVSGGLVAEVGFE